MNNIQIAALLVLTSLVALELAAAQQSAPLTQTADSRVEMLFAQKLFETGCTHERSMSTTSQEQAVAFLYMQEAAKRGHPGALYALGIYYKDNTGLPNNLNLTEKKRLTKALEYFNLAAEQNLPAAQNALGICYENGIGIEAPNPEKALEWYKKAAAQQDQNAQAGIKRCIEKLQKMLFEIQAATPAMQPRFPQTQVPQAKQAFSSSSSSSFSSGASSSSSMSSAQQQKTIQTLLSKRQEDAMDIETPKKSLQPSKQTAAIATLAASAGSIPPTSASSTATNNDPWVVQEITQELYKALGNNKKMTADLLGLKQATLDCCLQGQEDLIGEGTAAKVIVEFDIARNEKLLATAWRLKSPVIKRLCELVDDARATTPPNNPSSNANTTQRS